MALSSDVTTFKYNGDGVSTTFMVPFTVFSGADLIVQLHDVTNSIDVVPAPVLNGGGSYDYAFAGTFDPAIGEYVANNQIIFNAPLPATWFVAGERSVAALQQAIFLDNNKFPAKRVEGGLDRVTMLAQQLAGKVSRALLQALTTAVPNLVVPVAEAGKFWRWNAAGDGLENAAVVPSASVVQSSELVAGIIEIANQAEFDAGVDDQRATTPKKIANSVLAATVAAHTVAIAANTAAIHLANGFMRGLAINNNVADAVNDIDIAAGTARDNADSVDIALVANTTKRLDAIWAVGTNQGGLFNGVKANSTWYHLFVIKRTDTNVVDVGFDTDPNAVHIPAPYTKFRRLGAVLTDGAGSIRGFQIRGAPTPDREFYWNTPQLDVNAVNPGAAAVTRTLSTPLGVRTEALVSLGVFCNSTSTQPVGYLSDLALTDVAPDPLATAVFSGAGGQVVAINDTTSVWNWGQVRVWTDTNAQIRSRMTVSDAVTRLGIITRGWVEKLI